MIHKHSQKSAIKTYAYALRMYASPCSQYFTLIQSEAKKVQFNVQLEFQIGSVASSVGIKKIVLPFGLTYAW